MTLRWLLLMVEVISMAMMMKKRIPVIPLDTKGLTLSVVGGKGVNLALLARAGLPVPGGFMVPTDAYRAYVDANNLANFIRGAMKDLQTDDPAALTVASQAIRERFAAGTLPSDLAAAICDAYAELERPPVAVRSSATAEDLPDASFAGQQDTFLNVVEEKDLLESVVNCWSSLWTARAISYRARNAILQEGVALAVIVQRMVQSEASGVLFTAEPLSGKRTEYAIEATLGLGEALVSGQVEPDRYLVDAATGRILNKTLGAKAVSIQGRVGGGTVTLSQDAATRPALSDSAIGELVQLGRQVAEFFGSPQDIEWAWADDQLYLLQSRPITSLFPLPVGMAPDPLLVLFSFGAVQGLLDPITPLGQDAIKAIAAGLARLFGYRFTVETQTAFFTAGERLFINLTGLVRHPLLRHPLRLFLGAIGPGAEQAIQSLGDDPRLAPIGRVGFGAILRLIPAFMPMIGRLASSFLRPDLARRRFEQEMDELAAGFELGCNAKLTLAERLALFEKILGKTLYFALPRFVPRFGAGMGSLNLLKQVATRSLGEEFDIWAVTRGMPHNVTTEMDLTLWETATAIKSDPPSRVHFRQADADALAADYLAGRLPERAQTAVAGFLQRYGMRGLAEIDLGRPRWRENPIQIMQVLQSYLRIEDPNQAPDAVFQRGAASSKAAFDQLAARVRQTHGGRLKARLIRWAARRMRSLLGLRETPKFAAIRLMGIVRAALLDSGQELVAADLLTRPDDLFFLHLDELRALAAGKERDWAALVHERREIYAREQRRGQIPRLLLSDGHAFYQGVMAPAGESDQVLVGSPVSPGVVEGSVRVVLNPHEVQLEPGEILVCRGTDPAWTPLFLVAGGLVMEVGGLMTHGSVVAREYGIPAVVGVHQATTRLQTGQRVQVDGTAGQVVLL